MLRTHIREVRGHIRELEDRLVMTQIRDGKGHRLEKVEKTDLVLQTQIRDSRGRHRLRMVEDIY